MGWRTRARAGAGVRGAVDPRAADAAAGAVDPAEADALLAALRTHRDRAMVQAMLLGGLRRCEVLGLRLSDVHAGRAAGVHRRGQGRPSADRAGLGPVLRRAWRPTSSTERPATAATDRVFVVLQGPARGQPLSARPGWTRSSPGPGGGPGSSTLTCHQLRHTCFTRLREAGMALEAIQAQAGHRSIESTRIYLHLANDWLAGEYRRAARRSTRKPPSVP